MHLWGSIGKLLDRVVARALGPARCPRLCDDFPRKLCRFPSEVVPKNRHENCFSSCACVVDTEVPDRLSSCNASVSGIRRTRAESVGNAVGFIDAPDSIWQIISVKPGRAICIVAAQALVRLVQVAPMVFTPSLVYVLVYVAQQSQRIHQACQGRRHLCSRQSLARSRAADDVIRDRCNRHHRLYCGILSALCFHVT